MKKIFTLACSLLAFLSLNAQELRGLWKGDLVYGDQEIPLLFTFPEGDEKGYVESPTQTTEKYEITKFTLDDGAISIEVKSLGSKFEGFVEQGIIEGEIFQGGMTFPMELVSTTMDEVYPRPQTPKAPFEYQVEELKIPGAEKEITLAGTLTLPKAETYKNLAILITGSGPQNRDEELMYHKPFMVIADYLTKNGTAVFRYDERGVGESSGDFSTATSFDFGADVLAIVDHFSKDKRFQNASIGLIGHSEGGMIAPYVSNKNKNIKYIVLMAGTGAEGYEVILDQQSRILKAQGKHSDQDIKTMEQVGRRIFEYFKKNKDSKNIEKNLKEYIREMYEAHKTVMVPMGATAEMMAESTTKQYLSNWFREMLFYNPGPVLEMLQVPTLVLQGSKDLQVSEELNIPIIKNALKKSSVPHKIQVFESLNHLFQHCETGSVEEYIQIEQTISPEVLEVMSEWISNTKFERLTK
ncbi:MAG: alpha/beta fold hydrolase [Flavobacteriales bacterium]|jgi:alpha-beta hydrolase superfamily lysophospholipase|nr:alpha/beta fold hydrolase [Flavobacteriales bacterium]